MSRSIQAIESLKTGLNKPGHLLDSPESEILPVPLALAAQLPGSGPCPHVPLNQEGRRHSSVGQDPGWSPSHKRSTSDGAYHSPGPVMVSQIKAELGQIPLNTGNVVVLKSLFLRGDTTMFQTVFSFVLSLLFPGGNAFPHSAGASSSKPDERRSNPVLHVPACAGALRACAYARTCTTPLSCTVPGSGQEQHEASVTSCGKLGVAFSALLEGQLKLPQVAFKKALQAPQTFKP